MIGLILSGHSNFASVMRKMSEHIYGKQKEMIAIDFPSAESVLELKAKFRDAVAQFPVDTQILFMVDIKGGTPYNMASKWLASEPDRFGVVAGINLPMILEAYAAREQVEKAADLGSYIAIEGRKAIETKPEKANPISLPKVELPKSSSEHLDFTLVRIDSRLLHSQIASSWAKAYPSDRILVVSDKVANDALTKKLIIEAAPAGVKANVIPVERLAEVYRDANFSGLHAMVIFAGPEEIVAAVKQGVKFDQVNVGSMAYTNGKTRVNGVLAMNEQDKADFNYLIAHGVHFDVRRVPNDEGEELEGLLDRI